MAQRFGESFQIYTHVRVQSWVEVERRGDEYGKEVNTEYSSRTESKIYQKMQYILNY